MRLLAGGGVRSLTATPPTLEELFLRHYGDHLESRAATGRPERACRPAREAEAGSAMTATASTVAGPHRRRATRDPYTGTGALIRLNLRRERIPLLAWVLGIGAVAASTFSTIAALYPEPAERAALALSISANPAFLAITGPISDTSIGAISAWRVGAVGTSLVGLMAIFTVIRRTRADEETGRTELLSSSVVGRAAPLAAAVTVAVGASLAIGLLIAVAGIGSGEDAAGSLAFGARDGRLRPGLRRGRRDRRPARRELTHRDRHRLRCAGRRPTRCGRSATCRRR